MKSILTAIGVLIVAVSPAVAVEPGFEPLFDGQTLAGWEGNLKHFRIEKGAIVAGSLKEKVPRNEFLCTKRRYGDFELRLEFRLHGGKGNSGIQFRSKRVPESSAVTGYQADIGQNFWGALYDEHRRNKVLARPKAEQEKLFKKNGWNSYTIRAVGSRIVLKVNGETTVDYVETDDSIARTGIIALQVHSGPAMRIDFRKIRIRDLSER